MAGLSSLQGPHQVAQKFTSTSCPRSTLRLARSPCKVCKAKSGASAPTSGAGAESKAGEQADNSVRVNTLATRSLTDDKGKSSGEEKDDEDHENQTRSQ